MDSTPADIILMIRAARKRMDRERVSADRRTARVCMVIASAFFRKEGGFTEDDFMPGERQEKPRRAMSETEMDAFMEQHNKKVRKRYA